MNVTLKSVCNAKNYSSFELLKAKKELIHHKKQGQVFFDCDLGQLDWTDEFTLYFHLLPHKHSEINAFPVPLEHFQLHTEQRMQAHYLKEYFESYYEGKHWQDVYFWQYQAQKPFVGEKFVWYFKRRACFS